MCAPGVPAANRTGQRSLLTRPVPSPAHALVPSKSRRCRLQCHCDQTLASKRLSTGTLPAPAVGQSRRAQSR
eukprot:scaffold206682_cov31-Tisochrysis_lutea.AAC.3